MEKVPKFHKNLRILCLKNFFCCICVKVNGDSSKEFSPISMGKDSIDSMHPGKSRPSLDGSVLPG